MDLRVLGPVEAVVDARPLPLGARKQRAVLAMLALEANRPVSADRLSEGLWGESPPASAGKMVQHYIWQLRKALDGQDVTITTRAGGYELACPIDDVDLPVRVWTDTSKVRFGRYFAGLLRELGYAASLKVVNVGLDYFGEAGDPRNHAQIGMDGWLADYPTPATFFDPNFSCAGLAAPASLNLSRFCSPALDRQVAAAAVKPGPAGEDAWAAATRRLTDLAPAVPLDIRQSSYFTSARVGNVQISPVFGVMLERAWVR